MVQDLSDSIIGETFDKSAREESKAEDIEYTNKGKASVFDNKDTTEAKSPEIEIIERRAMNIKQRYIQESTRHLEELKKREVDWESQEDNIKWIFEHAESEERGGPSKLDLKRDLEDLQRTSENAKRQLENQLKTIGSMKDAKAAYKRLTELEMPKSEEELKQFQKSIREITDIRIYHYMIRAMMYDHHYEARDQKVRKVEEYLNNDEQ